MGNEQYPEALGDGAACAWPREPRSGFAKGGVQSWHLLQARTGIERATMDALKRYHVESYFPQARVYRVVPQRKLTPKQRVRGGVVRRPTNIALFPGYLFVRFDAGTPRWHELFDIVGLYGLVCSGGLPANVDENFIRHLRHLEVDGAVPGNTPVATIFSLGEIVRIDEGPLLGFRGVVESLSPKIVERLKNGTLEDLDDAMCATIGVEIFGRVSTVTIPMTQLGKI